MIKIVWQCQIFGIDGIESMKPYMKSIKADDNLKVNYKLHYVFGDLKV